MQLSSLISHDWRCEMGQHSAKFRLPIMLRFFALTYGASFSLLIWLMAVSTTHMRHTAPVFQWPCCHAQQQFEKIRMCFEFNYVHTHTHSHITFASWADRKEKRSNKHDFFVFLRGKWWCVRRLQETFPLFLWPKRTSV